MAVIYNPDLRDGAHKIADALQAAGFHTRTMDWNRYKEDDDGAMSRWIGRSTFLYGPPTVPSKVAEIEEIVAKLGFKAKKGHRNELQKHGTHWTFNGLDIYFWLLNED